MWILVSNAVFNWYVSLDRKWYTIIIWGKYSEYLLSLNILKWTESLKRTSNILPKYCQVWTFPCCAVSSHYCTFIVKLSELFDFQHFIVLFHIQEYIRFFFAWQLYFYADFNIYSLLKDTCSSISAFIIQRNKVLTRVKLRKSISLYTEFFLKIFLGFFFLFFSIHYSSQLHLLPLRFHCANRCWDRTQDRCNWCIGSQTL